MADAGYGDDGGHSPYGTGRAHRWMNIAGGVASVALVVGLGWWGFNLALRDARGVPVVRALEGPMRVAPEDPGGEVVDHQGLAVNDVAAEGAAAPPPDRLVLAPPPVSLAAEDGPGLEGLPPVPDPAAAAVPADAAPEAASAALESPAALVPVEPLAVPEGTDPAVAAALVEALGADEGRPENVVEVAALDEAGLPPPEGAITRSPRPPPRPDVRPAAEAAVIAAPAVIDAATLAPGTRLVQFGAFDSVAEAEAEWARLSGRFGELMAGKAMVVQAAESGGRTFWRLRAHGFEDEDDARRFCSALVAENANCIPVAHR